MSRIIIRRVLQSERHVVSPVSVHFLHDGVWNLDHYRSRVRDRNVVVEAREDDRFASVAVIVRRGDGAVVSAVPLRWADLKIDCIERNPVPVDKRNQVARLIVANLDGLRPAFAVADGGEKYRLLIDFRLLQLDEP